MWPDGIVSDNAGSILTVEGGKEAARLAQTLPILSGFLHYRAHHRLGTSSHPGSPEWIRL